MTKHYRRNVTPVSISLLYDLTQMIEDNEKNYKTGGLAKIVHVKKIFQKMVNELVFANYSSLGQEMVNTFALVARVKAIEFKDYVKQTINQQPKIMRLTDMYEYVECYYYLDKMHKKCDKYMGM